MRLNAGRLALAMMFAGLAACASHHRTYYESGGEVWGPDEVVYYNQWEVDTHRPHVVWEERRDDEHREYWVWRRQHVHDHDHDRDHDHDNPH
jgi:hypothetical protein